MTKQISPPIAKKIPHKLTTHNHTRIDNYYWLNQREDSEVIEYLEQENKYLDNMLGETEELQQKLYQEIIGRIKQQDTSVPYYSRGYYYYVRFEEGKEYPIYCRKKNSCDNAEEVMLNVNEMAEGHNFYQVSGLSVTMDNNKLAFGVDTSGRRQYQIYIKDLVSQEIKDCGLENTSGNVAWANDGTGFFFTEKDPISLRSDKIYRYYLADQKREIVFEEKDETFVAFTYKTKSSKYIMIGSYSTLSTEYRFIPADDWKQPPSIIQPRERNLEYSVDHYENYFYIVTNEQAKNFKLVKTPVEKTTKENWEDIIPHREEVLVESIEIFKDFLVVEEREGGLPQLRIFDWVKNEEHYLDFGEPAYMSYIATNREFDTPWLRYGYTSLTTPNSTYDYNMKTKEKKLLKEQEVVGGFDRNDYKSERIHARAEDGTLVPISLVYRKDTVDAKQRPLLLYAYGSYGHNIDASFSSARLSLLDRGFSFAIAHIRGGEDMGRWWYEDGKLLNKKNTFTDFICCASHLAEQNYTIFAEGGSAGGLLMGAIVNMAPDLFEGVISAVPFVDVVTTMLDDSIPLTTGEYDEWGNPNEKEYYDYMLSYSPYDNVKAQNYPHLLITTGLHDSQVQYWEPAKWVAKLRDIKTNDNLLLLKTDMECGHGGASGRFQRHKLTALEYAFLLHVAGIKE